MKKIIALGVLLLAAAFPIPSAAQAKILPLDEVLKRVKQVYAGHNCFKASFDQVRVNVAMDMRDRFKGAMYVKKPASIMLDVTEPEKQKVVIVGARYMVYFPEDGNAAKGEVPPDLNVQHFFGFFGKIESVDRTFRVNFAPKPMNEDGSLYLLKLTDRKDKLSPYTIILGIDSREFTVRRASVHDALGNYNRFNLSDIVFLKDIPDDRFRIDYDAQGPPLIKIKPGSAPK